MILEKLVIPIGFDTGLLMAGIDFIGESIGKFTDFLGDAVNSASASEDAISQLNAVIASTGGVAGITSEHAQELASSLQGVTKFSDEAILGAENMLLTFTSIGKDVFPEATKTALDMSEALGQDLKASSIQLGKALNDPINGVSALRRVGVQFTEDQEEVIKSLVETGRLEEAQTLILRELSREFGGSAEAAGLTFAGGIARLNNKFDDMKEKIGMAIMPTLSTLTDALSGLMDNPAIMAMVDGFIEQLGRIGANISTLAEDIAEGIDTGNWDAFFSDFEAFTGIDLKPLMDKLGEFSDWAINEGIPAWNNFVDNTKTGLADFSAGSQAETTAIKEHWNQLLDAIGSRFQIVFGDGKTLVLDWKQIGITALQAVDIILYGLGKTLEFFNGQLQKAIDLFSVLAGKSSVPAPSGYTPYPGYGQAFSAPSQAGNVKRRASGGPAGGLTWVGERGAELVNLPGGSQVNNAQASANMGFDYYKLASILAVEFAKVRD